MNGTTAPPLPPRKVTNHFARHRAKRAGAARAGSESVILEEETTGSGAGPVTTESILLDQNAKSGDAQRPSPKVVSESVLFEREGASREEKKGGTEVVSESVLLHVKNGERSASPSRRVISESALFEVDMHARQQELSFPRFPGIAIERLVVRSGQAAIYKGTFTESLKLPVAVKVVHVDQNAQTTFVTEVQALRALRHPNILPLEAFFEAPFFAIVTKWMEKGSLRDVLDRFAESRTLCAWDDAGKRMAMGVAHGLVYLHSQNVIHRDLKSLNVLVGLDDVPVLCDFGLSRSVEAGKTTFATTQAGTLQWMAPETISDGTFSFKSDMYAFGVILWEILSCEKPYAAFESAWRLCEAVLKGTRPPQKPDWPEHVRGLMLSCWDALPSRRPQASRVLELLALEPRATDAVVAAVAPATVAVKKVEEHPIRDTSPAEDLEMAKLLRCQNKLPEALQHLRRAADNGDAKAMSLLAIAYESGGWTLKKNLPQAAFWWEKACGVEYAPAMAAYATHLQTGGFGFRMDPKLALKLCTKVLASNDPLALAIVHHFGAGNVRADGKKAEKFYAEPAAMGDTWAQVNLGRLLRDRKLFSIAAGWFEKAASQGSSSAMLELGILSLLGKGVARNLERAKTLFAAAEKHGVDVELSLSRRGIKERP